MCHCLSACMKKRHTLYIGCIMIPCLLLLSAVLSSAVSTNEVRILVDRKVHHVMKQDVNNDNIYCKRSLSQKFQSMIPCANVVLTCCLELFFLDQKFLWSIDKFISSLVLVCYIPPSLPPTTKIQQSHVCDVTNINHFPSKERSALIGTAVKSCANFWGCFCCEVSRAVY